MEQSKKMAKIAYEALDEKKAQSCDVEECEKEEETK